MLKTLINTPRSSQSPCLACSSRAYSAASKHRSSRPRPRPAASSASSAAQVAAESSVTPSGSPTTPTIAAETRPQPSWVRQPGPPSSAPRRAGAAAQELREPPLVEAARKKSVSQRNVFESYLVLPWSTRLKFWLVVAAVGVVGLYGGDYLFPPEQQAAGREGEKEVEAGAGEEGVKKV